MQDDEFLKKLLEEKKLESGDEKSEDEDGDEEGSEEEFESGDGNGDETDDENQDEDDDQNFISKQDPIEQLCDAVKEELKKTSKSLDGVRPEGNQQRNLSRETGGLEVDYEKQVHVEDAWDNRSEEVDKMGGEDVQEDVIDAGTSSSRQGFIHMQKQKKKQGKKNVEASKDALESHAQKVQEAREKAAKNKGGGGRGA